MSKIEARVKAPIEEKIKIINSKIVDIVDIFKELAVELQSVSDMINEIPVYYSPETLNDVLIKFLQHNHLTYEAKYIPDKTIGFINVTKTPDGSTELTFETINKDSSEVEQYVFNEIVSRDTQYLIELSEELNVAMLWVFVKENKTPTDKIPLGVQKQMTERGLVPEELETEFEYAEYQVADEQ